MANYIPRLIGVCDNCGVRLDYNKSTVYSMQLGSLFYCSLECLLEHIQKKQAEKQKEPDNG